MFGGLGLYYVFVLRGALRSKTYPWAARTYWRILDFSFWDRARQGRETALESVSRANRGWFMQHLSSQSRW